MRSPRRGGERERAFARNGGVTPRASPRARDPRKPRGSDGGVAHAIRAFVALLPVAREDGCWVGRGGTPRGGPLEVGWLLWSPFRAPEPSLAGSADARATIDRVVDALSTIPETIARSCVRWRRAVVASRRVPQMRRRGRPRPRVLLANMLGVLRVVAGRLHRGGRSALAAVAEGMRVRSLSRTTRLDDGDECGGAVRPFGGIRGPRARDTSLDAYTPGTPRTRRPENPEDPRPPGPRDGSWPAALSVSVRHEVGDAPGARGRSSMDASRHRRVRRGGDPRHLRRRPAPGCRSVVSSLIRGNRATRGAGGVDARARGATRPPPRRAFREATRERHGRSKTPDEARRRERVEAPRGGDARADRREYPRRVRVRRGASRRGVVRGVGGVGGGETRGR